ncbi:hypothetical protein TEA_002879 [Camellia sinensis var. sinensis]|uniref:Uncharacterized protein n=1 Tax=Camellia sinensis var. sinensis TaxID=542762 RepID=A0A4S4D0T2_CAMSN|nr:hypothetical protein TEA_002879 [Camellia sinensis var. sinensis]
MMVANLGTLSGQSLPFGALLTKIFKAHHVNLEGEVEVKITSPISEYTLTRAGGAENLLGSINFEYEPIPDEEEPNDNAMPPNEQSQYWTDYLALKQERYNQRLQWQKAKFWYVAARYNQTGQTSGEGCLKEIYLGRKRKPDYSPAHDNLMCYITGHQRGGGCAKGIKEWGTGKKLDIQFDENYCPIGDNVAKLTTQLGIIVRNGNIVPLTFVDWNSVPDDIVDAIWKDVKDNLNICPEEYKPICMKNCNSIWKDHKNKLKAKYFKPSKGRMSMKDDVPMHIVPSQWEELVEYWRTSDAEKIPSRNAKNQRAHGIAHTTGRTTFSQIRHEMTSKGESTDKMNVWLMTRRGDGPVVIQTLVDEFNRQLSMLPEDGRTLEARNAIFHELIELKDELREELRAEFSTHLQQMRAEMMALVSQGVPDASSGHRAFRESAEDENPYTPPPEDQELAIVDIEFWHNILFPLLLITIATFSSTKTQPFNNHPPSSLRYSFPYNPSNSAPFANHAALASSNPAVVIDTLPTLLSQGQIEPFHSIFASPLHSLFFFFTNFPCCNLARCSSNPTVVFKNRGVSGNLAESFISVELHSQLMELFSIFNNSGVVLVTVAVVELFAIVVAVLVLVVINLWVFDIIKALFFFFFHTLAPETAALQLYTYHHSMAPPLHLADKDDEAVVVASQEEEPRRSRTGGGSAIS